MSAYSLDDFALLDPRLTLILAEWLSPVGICVEAAAFLAARAGWSEARIQLLDRAVQRYWARATALARRSGYLPPPRRRNIGVVIDPDAVRPYSQILNTSTWTLYASDLDPAASSAEFVCYLLVQGDRHVQVGEISLAAVHLAPYWFERSPSECEEFAAAAAKASRPDAAAYRAIAAALPWLRELRHRGLRPPRSPGGHREIPGTGILVPRALEDAPNALVAETRKAATAALGAFYARWTAPGDDARRALLDWLIVEKPPLVIAARGQRVVWDHAAPECVDALADELAAAGEVALRDVRADLVVAAERTRTFLDALVEPDALPRPAAQTAQSGYVYMHRERAVLAYNLHEPGIERLLGPAIPYSREMLGARAMHEWAHRAADAGWIPLAIEPAEWVARQDRLAAIFEEVIARTPRAVREHSARELAGLGPRSAWGAALTRVLVGRMEDFQANLLAARLLPPAERETYVRQNIRPLRGEVPPGRLWTMLARALYEFQYLCFSASRAPLQLFLGSTWFADDFLASGAVREADLEALLDAAGELCSAHAIDRGRFRLA